MHTVNLISQAIQEHHIALPTFSKKNVCCVTGLITECIPRTYLFSDAFTNINLLKAPGSFYVSIDAYQALKYPFERKSSWFCNKKQFIRLKRNEIYSFLLGYKKENLEAWSGYITSSYKKHGALLTPVNNKNKHLWIFDDVLVDCSDTGKITRWYNRLSELHANGINKTAMLTLMPNLYGLKQIKLQAWLIFKEWASKLNRYKSGLYKLLVYTL